MNESYIQKVKTFWSGHSGGKFDVTVTAEGNHIVVKAVVWVSWSEGQQPDAVYVCSGQNVEQLSVEAVTNVLSFVE